MSNVESKHMVFGEGTTYIACPHCDMLMELPHQEINCAIYRHGVLKATGQQMDPHAPKALCDHLARNGLIYGCGKPFRVVKNRTGGLTVERCGYV